MFVVDGFRYVAVNKELLGKDLQSRHTPHCLVSYFQEETWVVVASVVVLVVVVIVVVVVVGVVVVVSVAVLVAVVIVVREPLE